MAPVHSIHVEFSPGGEVLEYQVEDEELTTWVANMRKAVVYGVTPDEFAEVLRRSMGSDVALGVGWLVKTPKGPE